MGAVTFSLDPRLVEALQTVVAARVFVETGTFKGDTLVEMSSAFDRLISIELSDALWRQASQRLTGYANIELLQGPSDERLQGLHSELNQLNAIYWLDAHWCVATDTAGALSQCPLLGELRAIGRLNSQSVILIDDARFFLAPPLAPHEISQWPTFDQIVAQLRSMSDAHELMVINDVIAFYPKAATEAMNRYAQTCGIDWLDAVNGFKECPSIKAQLEEKEVVIQQLAQALNEAKAQGDAHLSSLTDRDQSLQQKDALILELTHAMKVLRLTAQAAMPLSFVSRRLRGVKNRIVSIFRPRLGNLNQYAPRTMTGTGLPTGVLALESPPSISIVTPSFRQGNYIERTLKSVLDQNYPKLEYFVQDGGSTDTTVAVLRRYEQQLSGWVSARDGGQSQAINAGLQKTSGEIMAWLNSDDLLMPGTLNKVAEYFAAHPDVDVLYGDRLLIDEEDREIGRWLMPAHDNEVLSWADYVPQETMFWRRRIWDKAGGGIDESFRFAMDWDLLVRFRDAGAKFAHLPYFLGAFRIHSQQKTSAEINEVGFMEMNRIRERALGHVPTRSELKKALAPYLIRHILVDLRWRIKTRVLSK